MAAPVGSCVTIAPYDLTDGGPGPQDGDYLVSYSELTDRFGTAYLVVGTRQVRSDVHPNRYALRCQVLGPYDPQMPTSPGARFFPIVWYRRNRRRPR
jgi:hypothetical protein